MLMFGQQEGHMAAEIFSTVDSTQTVETKCEYHY